MTVVVSTPSRLHFGLLRFQQPEGQSFGGLGMMIAEPGWQIELQLAERWTGEGVDHERAMELGRRVMSSLDEHGRRAAMHVRVTSAIPSHRGLGGGTQLALAVAAGVRQLLGLPPANAAELAATVGRGHRSAIGTHGFLHGGLLWETGRHPIATLGQLAARETVPDIWRIVLIDSRRQSGLSGASENDAFRVLPSVPQEVTERLTQLAENQILPAARSADFRAFGEGVYEYGRLAGECFTTVQGGPYASREIADCVHAVRRLDIPGVGQSSWGPTVFAVTESQHQAEWLVQSLSRSASAALHTFQIVAPDNQGATTNGEPFSPRSPTEG